jgi:phage terminase large subunit-like protein
MRTNMRRSPKFDSVRHSIDLLQQRSKEEQREIIRRMSPMDALKFDADFETWAHEGQLPPKGEGWRVWLMMAGRGFGKTRAGAEWIHRLATRRSGLRIALVGANINETRRVMIEGVSGLLTIARRERRRVDWEPALGRFRWRNGSQAQLFSGDNADGLRGPEHDFAWADELAKWREAEEAWMNLQFGLRRGQRPRALITTTPRPIEILTRMMEDKWTVTTRGRTGDNINLDERTIEILTETYGGTRIGRQELDGELLKDIEGALWTEEMIERSRVGLNGTAGFDRIVVGVDPPAGVGEKSDACGIVVAGSRGEALFVLEDATVRGLSPEGWANRVAAAAARWNTQLIVAEANNGGAMVESVIKAANFGLKVRLVHASRGKCARAEPIALRFEAGKAFFAGKFPELEAELGRMIAGGGDVGGKSPDRADAMVWAMTVLSETRSGVPRVKRL